MKIGGASLADDLRRIEAVAEIVDAGPDRRRRQRPLRPRDRARRTAARSSPTGCAGTRRPAIRSTTRCRRRSPSQYAPPLATGENLFSHQDARNLLRYGGHAPGPRRPPVRSRARLRADRVPADARRSCGTTAGRRAACVPHGGHQFALAHRGRACSSAATSPTPTSSSRSAASPTTRRSRTARSRRARRPGSASSARPRCTRCSPRRSGGGSSSRA